MKIYDQLADDDCFVLELFRERNCRITLDGRDFNHSADFSPIHNSRRNKRANCYPKDTSRKISNEREQRETREQEQPGRRERFEGLVKEEVEDRGRHIDETREDSFPLSWLSRAAHFREPSRGRK